MTHILKTFTDLLPKSPTLDEVKAEFLQKAEAVGMTDFLREHSISHRTVEYRVQEEISDFMTANVAEIIEQRGRIPHDQIELLGFVHEDRDEDFIAAVRDAVEVSYVYQTARDHFQKDERSHNHNSKNAGSKEDVQRFVTQLTTTHPALVGPPTMHALDEMMAQSHASAPWMRDLSTWVYKALRARYSAGQTWLTLPPVILIGPPGCGKTTYARKLAALSGVRAVRTATAVSNISQNEVDLGALSGLLAGSDGKTLAKRVVSIWCRQSRSHKTVPRNVPQPKRTLK